MGTTRRNLLRQALKQTNYTTYLVASWSMLLVMSAVGNYRMSIHPNEPAGLMVFTYALLALWVAVIVMTVREHLKASRLVKRHLAAIADKPSAPAGAT